MSSRPTVQELYEQLYDLIDWELFGFCLPGITRRHINVINRNNSTVQSRKLELFDTWLRRSPKASWNDVIGALESVDEMRIAERVREKYTDAFIRSVRGLRGKMKYIVATLHGPPGAGKSSVKQLLLGFEPLPKSEQNSTDIMNSVRAVRTSQIAAGQSSNFKKITNEELFKMIAQKVKIQLERPETSSLELSPYLEQPIDPDTKLLMDLNELLENVEPSNELFDLEWIYLIDSGGQPQFSDILPFLYHHQSLHIVVFRLTDGLNSKPPVRYYRNGNDQYMFNEELSLTNLEYIERMCEIAEAAKKYANFPSSVLVIGTHLDQLPEDETERDQILQKMNRELWDKLKKYSNYLILQCGRKNEEKIIFSVNAIVEKGDQREQYSTEIQRQVMKASNEHKNKTLPVKWLALQLDLVEQGSVLDIHQCNVRGGYLGMLVPEIQEALRFFKEVGLNLHYPDSGCDLVFTKLDPLISRLSILIKASFDPPPGITAGKSTELRERGLFDQLLLEDVTNFELIRCDSFSNDNFLKLLTHLKVIRPVRMSIEKRFFLPSALASTSLSNPFEIDIDASTSPLIATFNDKILPPGFFMMLIIQLLEDESGVLDYDPGEDKSQWRNAVLLVVNKTSTIQGGGLVVVDKRRWIEFYFCDGPPTCCSTLFPIIKHALESTANKMMNLGTSKISYGFFCLVCEKNDHICILNESMSSVQCLKKRTKNKEIDRQNRPYWLLGEVDQGIIFVLFMHSSIVVWYSHIRLYLVFIKW